ncbi:MAG: helix-turn-helix domain-containing protein [Methanobrevibacter sp.]|nr:helix-turn-helix domain-containing protein [Methanobrevibacter sp.]
MNLNKVNNDSNNNEYFENGFKEDEGNLIEEVHISTALSSKKIVELIDEYPNLKIVTCPMSIYKRISKKYLEVLEKLGISVKIRYNWGKPVKYTENDRKNVVNLIKEGIFPEDIAKKLNISVQAVYYLKNKKKDEKTRLKRGKRKKYSVDIREKVKKLANEGVPVKKISKNENIPLRTVYDLIKEE